MPTGPLDRLVTLPGGRPELTLGFEAIRWAHKFLRQPNGRRAGLPLQLTQTQIHFLLWWYAVDSQGQFLYRRGVRRLAKGSGKSPFAAVMALVELCAPVRLECFDPSAFGGCVGKPVAMPLVQIAATAETQTENTMRMVRAFAPKGSRVVRDHGLDPGLSMYYKAGGGKLHVISSSSAAAEGSEATFIVGDEPEHWVPGNGGPKFAATLADNLAKSGSRMIETCNAWEPGVGSVAEASFDAWVAQEEGRTRSDAQILYDARVAPAGTDLADEASLTAALEHVYGDCWWQTEHIRDIRDRIWDPQSKPADSRRKYLNQPVADESAWTTPQAWAVLARPDIIVGDGEQVVLFFDGSKSRDATALVGCRVSDGHVFTLGVWEPEQGHDRAAEVDAAEVDAVVRQACDRLTVVGFFADVREWESFAKVSWPADLADDLLVHAVPGGKDPQPIAWDMRTHVYDFGVACELTQAEILDRSFTHDGDSALTRHVLNARPYATRGVYPIRKADPTRKIDAAVCMVGARMVRRIALTKVPKQRTGMAYFK